MSAELREAAAGPGTDTRSWCSYGLVTGDDPVTFDPELGPLVDVVLQPDAVPVVCRVGGQVAGFQEGEYHPFGPGEEVLVMVPQGDEKAGCVIIARLGNTLDPFPRTVAGQDATSNKFAFKRLRAPYIIETAGGYLIRSAITKSQIGIDDVGSVFLNDGSGARLMLSSDVVGLETGDGNCKLQLKPEAGEVILRAGEARLTLSNDPLEGSSITTPTTLTIGTAGHGGIGHAVTIEQVLNLIDQIFFQIYTQAGPPGSPVLNTFFNTTLAGGTYLVPAVPLAASTPISPLLTAPLVLALAVPPDPLGLIPGIGRGSLLL